MGRTWNLWSQQLISGCHLDSWRWEIQETNFSQPICPRKWNVAPLKWDAMILTTRCNQQTKAARPYPPNVPLDSSSRSVNEKNSRVRSHWLHKTNTPVQFHLVETMPPHTLSSTVHPEHWVQPVAIQLSNDSLQVRKAKPVEGLEP